MKRMLWPSTILTIGGWPSFCAFGFAVIIGIGTQNFDFWWSVGVGQFVVIFGALMWFTRRGGAYHAKWLAHIRGSGMREKKG